MPCLVAAYVGDLVTRAGVPHAHYPHLAPVAIPSLAAAQGGLPAATAFGLTSLLFVELTHGIKRLMALLTH